MPEKITRAAFLYLDPKPPGDRFAQCGTCMMFAPGQKRCSIHGPSVKVTADMSCGLYVHGEPEGDRMDLMAVVTPEESGLVRRQVRCENCTFFDGQSVCGLYEKLNAALAVLFSLDSQVDPKGCCNAQTPGDEQSESPEEEAGESAEDERQEMLRSLK